MIRNNVLFLTLLLPPSCRVFSEKLVDATYGCKRRAPDNPIARALQQMHVRLNRYVRKEVVFLRLCEKGNVAAQK